MVGEMFSLGYGKSFSFWVRYTFSFPKRKRLAAQSGLEYIILFAVILAALVPIFVYTTNTSSLDVKAAHAREAVRTIAEAADNLYKLGGGKNSIFVTFPDDINSTFVGNNTIRLRLSISGGFGDAIATTNAPVSGSLPTKEGLNKITLEVIGNTVQIS